MTESKSRDPQIPKNGKRISSLLIAGAVALTIAASAVAFASPRHSDFGHGIFMGRFAEKKIDRALDVVGAREEQRVAIRAIVEETKGQLETQRSDGPQRGHEALVELLAAETVDREALETLRQAQIARMNMASQTMLNAAVRISEVLDPDQRAQLATHWQERAQERRERRGQHHGNHGDRE